MASSQKHWIKSTEFKTGIALLALSGISTAIYDFFKEKPLFSTIWAGIIWLYNSFVTILAFKIGIYWFLLFLIIIIFILFILNKSKKVFEPHLQYTTDILIKWRWQWQYSGSRITQLTPLCPDCNTIMSYNNLDYYKLAECPRCEKKFSGDLPKWDKNSYFEDDYKIQLLIIDNLQKKNFTHF